MPSLAEEAASTERDNAGSGSALERWGGMTTGRKPGGKLTGGGGGTGTGLLAWGRGWRGAAGAADAAGVEDTERLGPSREHISKVKLSYGFIY
jgi:hypothetical protein